MVKILDLSEHMGPRIAGRLEGISRYTPDTIFWPYGVGQPRYLGELRPPTRILHALKCTPSPVWGRPEMLIHFPDTLR
jgi:hypothetical protein